MLKHTPPVYIPVEPEDNGLFIPLLLSTLVHILIIAFVFFTHRVPHIEFTQSIETSIITQAELEAIEARIGENRQAMASQSQATSDVVPNAQEAQIDDGQDVDIGIDFNEFVEDIYRKPPARPADNTSATVTTNELIIENDATLIEPLEQAADSQNVDTASLKEQERLYQEQVARFAAEIDDDLHAQQTMEAQRLKRNKQASLVEALNEQTTQPKSTSPKDSGRINVEFAPAERAQSAGNLTSSDTGVSGASGATASTNAGADVATVQAELRQLIYSRWTPPTGSTGKRVTAVVIVNTNTGIVTSVTITGADNALLEQSLEDAIYAEPLTPVIGTEHSRLNLVLNAR